MDKIMINNYVKIYLKNVILQRISGKDCYEYYIIIFMRKSQGKISTQFK